MASPSEPQTPNPSTGNRTNWNPLTWFSTSPSSPQPAIHSPSPLGATSNVGTGCPVKRENETAGTGGGCPIKSPPYDRGDTPASIEESANHPQIPHPSQKLPLSTHRVTSSIPRDSPATSNDETSAAVPTHQPTTSSNWVYPSEQQFYNAIRRKGYTADESEISTIVRIHNSVNERTWREVRKWESELHGCDEPRLVRFVGRPNDLSPKAWWNKTVMCYEPPFDRHDWFVEREDGSVTRYVIDFYTGGGAGSRG
eukprot:CAMPEP_0172515842 /NCGR_PEP_ID=MMETSP1066-20121228/271225_1 /TAXON_ID=671091 /ORGANISM="Coscinodiscus wailesii, Strain CCMP2513" /LENGTH=253 /DNA_ID=CAMNT_0013297055 /DNA_START=141 /DNA_END=898 /DNA_ORIENTATION=+